MFMLWFWLLVGISVIVVGGPMAWLFFNARGVPDKSEANPHMRRRLNPDQLRMLSYVAITLLLLCCTMVELWLFYG